MSKSTTDKRGAENGFARMDTDTRYRVLASEERRIVLDTLEGTTSVSLDTLASEVTERNRDTNTEEQAKIALVHQHLPMLSDAGVVEFDRETGDVTHSESALEALLRLL